MKAKNYKIQLATKDDLKKLTTKIELKKTEKVLRQEILRVEERVEGLEEKLDTRFDKVMTSLDSIAGTLDDLRTENTVGANQIKDLRFQVGEHEKRITNLESA